jgi:hypothetical protein
MTITTLQQANALDCCPCDLPECTPRKECRSISASVISSGFYKPGETSWKLYASRSFNYTITISYVDGGYSESGSASEVNLSVYQIPFEGSAGSGEDCPVWDGNLEETCTTSGTMTTTGRDGLDELVYINTITRTQTSGTIPGDPCEWRDDFVNTDYSEDPPVVTNSTEYNTAAATIYSGLGSDSEYSTVYADPLTRDEWVAAVIAKLNTDLPAVCDECYDGTDCKSSIDADPEPTVAFDADIGVDAVLAGYRFGVPEDFSTTEAPRSTWEMQWDLVNASLEWWEWYDDGMTGDEPTPGPTLVSSESWTWGGDMDEPWSEWFEIPIPESGETRVVNVMTICWRSTRIGTKPTAWGDQVEIPT